MKVGVLIPSYNHARYVREAVESALAQTRPPDEVVVVDDGSNDDSVAILKGYGDRIRLHACAPRGIGATYNHLVRSSSADVVAFLESDDSLDPSYLEGSLRSLELHDVPWVSTARTIIDSDGRPTGRVLGKRSPGPHFTTESFLAGDIGLACTPVVRRGALVDVGPFVTDYRGAADSEMSLRFSTLYPMAYVEQPLYRYRRHDTNVSGGALQDSEEVLEIFRRFQESTWARNNPVPARKGLARLAGRVASLRIRSDPAVSRSQALTWLAEARRFDPWNLRNLRRYVAVRLLGPGAARSLRRGRSLHRSLQ
jgi:glycosyltransferase involved in cell wall biosynthesis